jgi:prephenate dehydrogenase
MQGEKLFTKTAIIGVGLIGGSLARVMKARGIAEKVVGSGRGKANIEKALELGVIDEALPAEDAVKSADAVFLCGPALSVLPTLEKIAPHVSPNALVTDAASTKRAIVEGAEKIADGRFTFIGSHPIAGTEKSGAEASFEKLFDGHKCIVTPTASTPSGMLEKLETFWQRAGMNTIRMDAETHDRAFGAVSHLPHMVVFALVNAVCDMQEEQDLINYAAGGFRDFTRIASSPPEMWADVALTNADILTRQMGMVKEQFEEIASAIADGDRERLVAIFHKSNAFRQKLF